MKLTVKQRRFIEEYIIDYNATQAAIRAGYSEKTAAVIGVENLIKPKIKNAIDEHLAALRDAKLADAYEVEAYLTKVLRGESKSNTVVIEGKGEGITKARLLTKLPDERERLKAAEILARRHGLTDTKIKIEGVNIQFTGEAGLK